MRSSTHDATTTTTTGAQTPPSKATREATPPTRSTFSLPTSPPTPFPSLCAAAVGGDERQSDKPIFDFGTARDDCLTFGFWVLQDHDADLCDLRPRRTQVDCG